jgi:hypothetical protein
MTEMSPAPITFPVGRTSSCPFDPPAAFAELRENNPISQASCPACFDAC